MTDIDLLTQMLVQLEVLTDVVRGMQKDDQRLGFCDPPSKFPKTVKVNPTTKPTEGEGAACLWYSEDRHKTRIPYSQTAIEGRIKSLSIGEGALHKGKNPPVIRIEMDAGERLVLQAGLETAFARSVWLTISRIPVKALQSPVGISVYLGKEGGVFAKFYNPKTGDYAEVSLGEGVKWCDVDWTPIINQAIEKVKQANQPPD